MGLKSQPYQCTLCFRPLRKSTQKDGSGLPLSMIPRVPDTFPAILSNSRVRRDIFYTTSPFHFFAHCLNWTWTFAGVFSVFEGESQVPGDWWVEVLHCAAEMPARWRSGSSSGQKECIQKQ